jgi:Tol biopolymer transport system component
MWMIDRATGATVNDLPTQSFGGGTHPDFRPDGTELVFASNKGDGPSGSSLVLIPFNANDGSWGQPAELLPPAQDQSNLFPMFSPDGEWIAFAAGHGGHDDPRAQLALIAEAGGTPIELVNANRVVSNVVTDGQHQNSQPTWAPPGDYNWIAFNTMRAYGVVLPKGTQQIWVAAVDLSKAANGEDASYPAFRVPFQGLYENNHRAYWTLDVGQGGSGGAGGGGQGGAGGSAPCTEILHLGDPCDQLNDCCETGSYCDTLDDGQTFECVQDIPW